MVESHGRQPAAVRGHFVWRMSPDTHLPAGVRGREKGEAAK